VPADLSHPIKSGRPLSKMLGYHHFQVTRDDDTSCTLVFSSPGTAIQFPQHEVLVKVFHPSDGLIIEIHHSFTDCELDNRMRARYQFMHPRLPAPFYAELWPRHVLISLGDAVWKATDVMISESRAEENSWVYVARTERNSEPGTPFDTE